MAWVLVSLCYVLYSLGLCQSRALSHLQVAQLTIPPGQLHLGRPTVVRLAVTNHAIDHDATTSCIAWDHRCPATAQSANASTWTILQPASITLYVPLPTVLHYKTGRLSPQKRLTPMSGCLKWIHCTTWAALACMNLRSNSRLVRFPPHRELLGLAIRGLRYAMTLLSIDGARGHRR